MRLSSWWQRLVVEASSDAIGGAFGRSRSVQQRHFSECSRRGQTSVFDARFQGTIKIGCPLHSVVVTVPQGPRQIAPGFNLGNGVLSTKPESRRQFRRTPSSLQDLMGSLMTLYPTLKRGAIRLCPFGTSLDKRASFSNVARRRARLRFTNNPRSGERSYFGRLEHCRFVNASSLAQPFCEVATGTRIISGYFCRHSKA